jgi:hypothetical protein
MYKRNQVEGAIARIAGSTSGPGSDLPSPELSIRLKRLTETDRNIGADRHASHVVFQTFAFFDQAAPGRGGEVSYSAYCAFALYLAFRLMEAGLPQRDAVAFLRRIRGSLEGEHARILRQSPEVLLAKNAPYSLETAIRNGRLVSSLERMVFVVVLAGDPWPLHAKGSQGETSSANICRGPEKLNKVMESFSRTSGPPLVSMELVNPVFQLSYWLEKIPPVRRGRK